MTRAHRLIAAAIGVAVVLPAAALVPGASAGAEQAPPASAPAAEAEPATASAAVDAATRLSFTDERDALYELTFGGTGGECPDPDGCPEPPPPEFGTIEHEGEASNSGMGITFVSTRHSDAGDVYLRNGAGEPTRLTCDPDPDTDPEAHITTETHPVGRSVFLGESTDPDLLGWYTADVVAYAADDADGDWDIYLSMSPAIFHEIIIGRVAPGWAATAPERGAVGGATSAVSAEPAACDDSWRTVNLTETADTDELWPTWVGDGQVVFSVNAAGELPDLGMIPLSWGIDEAGDPPEATMDRGSFVALTTTDVYAETQPAGMVVDPGSEGWIAFTTTEFREDGSLAVMPPAADAPAVNLFNEGGRPPQSSEAAWTSSSNPDAIAFTSTTADPYGDVFVADLETSDPPSVDSYSNLTGPGRGVGESHPAWTDSTTSESDPRRSVVFTRRTVGNYVDNPEGADRHLDGDIGDVLALSGDDRRVILFDADGSTTPPTPYDEAGPSYSPDGEQIAYSRALSGRGNRMLFVADAEGAGADLLLPASERDPDASDTDPAWSPDGSRVAFVRTVGVSGTAVWVYDMQTGQAVRISEDDVIDLHPTWSPDGRWIMVGRSRIADSEFDWEEDGGRRQRAQAQTRGPSLWVLDSENPDWEGQALDTCNDGCSVEGRSPSWSPLGDTVAFVDRGALYTVAVGTGPGEFGWAAEDPVALTGFTYDPEADVTTPTASRGEIESAEDPAWAPDGSEIAFAGQPTGQPDNRGIYAITPEGDEWRLITDDRGPDTEPAYSDRREADIEVAASVTGSPVLVGMSVVVDFTVTNLGPATAFDVALDTSFSAGAQRTVLAPVPIGCAVSGLQCNFAMLAPGESRVYRVEVEQADPVNGLAEAVVESATPDPALTNNEASAPYQFLPEDSDIGDLRVRIRMDEPVGYVGGTGTATVVVRNVGPDPVDNVTLSVDWPPGFFPLPDLLLPICLVVHVPCGLGTLNPGARVEYSIVVRLHTAGERVPVAARVATTSPELTLVNNRHRTLLDVLQPELHILPGVARPGQVVLAYGEQLPPGTEVEVDWAKRTEAGLPLGDPITVDPGPYRVEEDGTVRIPLLVLRRDLLGERILTATSRTAEFLPLEAPLVVVLRQLGPPLFVGRG